MNKSFIVALASLVSLSANAAYTARCTVSYEKIPGKNYYVNVSTPELSSEMPYSMLIKNDGSVSQTAEDLSSAKFGESSKLINATLISFYNSKEMLVVVSNLNNVGELEPLSRATTTSKNLRLEDVRKDIGVSCTRTTEE